MRSIGPAIRLIAIGAGLLIMFFPLISVWRVSGEVLSELPALSASATTTDRNRLALFDDDLVVATRIYGGVSPVVLREALVSDGFQTVNVGGERWLAKPCCGEYDAAWVRVDEVGADSAKAVVTVADGDVQASWPFFSLLGLTVVFGGLVLATLVPGDGRRRRGRLTPRSFADRT